MSSQIVKGAARTVMRQSNARILGAVGMHKGTYSRPITTTSVAQKWHPPRSVNPNQDWPDHLDEMAPRDLSDHTRYGYFHYGDPGWDYIDPNLNKKHAWFLPTVVRQKVWQDYVENGMGVEKIGEKYRLHVERVVWILREQAELLKRIRSGEVDPEDVESIDQFFEFWQKQHDKFFHLNVDRGMVEANETDPLFQYKSAGGPIWSMLHEYDMWKYLRILEGKRNKEEEYKKIAKDIEKSGKGKSGAGNSSIGDVAFPVKDPSMRRPANFDDAAGRTVTDENIDGGMEFMLSEELAEIKGRVREQKWRLEAQKALEDASTFNKRYQSHDPVTETWPAHPPLSKAEKARRSHWLKLREELHALQSTPMQKSDSAEEDKVERIEALKKEISEIEEKGLLDIDMYRKKQGLKAPRDGEHESRISRVEGEDPYDSMLSDAIEHGDVMILQRNEMAAHKGRRLLFVDSSRKGRKMGVAGDHPGVEGYAGANKAGRRLRYYAIREPDGSLRTLTQAERAAAELVHYPKYGMSGLPPQPPEIPVDPMNWEAPPKTQAAEASVGSSSAAIADTNADASDIADGDDGQASVQPEEEEK
eukprot:Clim_evm7s223 gene=Clim_evmTU7s223